MSVQSELRPTDVLARTYELVRENRAENAPHPRRVDAVRYADGELAALEWALGRRDLSPLTSQPSSGVPGAAELDRERWACVDMLHRRSEMDRRGEYYVTGVEATLMWILGKTDSEPF